MLTINISNQLNLPNFPMRFSVRGACGSFLFLAVNFGVVIAFTLGAYCNYHVTPLFAIAINVLFVALFLVFPETPLFLMKQKRISVRVSCDHSSYSKKLHHKLFIRSNLKNPFDFIKNCRLTIVNHWMRK